jgi:hydrogenase maturation protein HypF
VALAGADAAIRHPWRIALALLDDAFDGEAPLDALRLFSAVPPGDVTVVRQMLRARLRSPLAHGAGRYFDGIGSLVLARPDSRYEGQVALAWDGAADPSEAGSYDYAVHCAHLPWQVDLRPMVLAVVRDLLAGVSAATIAARFHNTLTAATAEIVRRTARLYGALPVVLTGGCFQNARLAERLEAPSAGAPRRRWARARAGRGCGRAGASPDGLGRGQLHVSWRSGKSHRSERPPRHRRLLGRAQAGTPGRRR